MWGQTNSRVLRTLPTDLNIPEYEYHLLVVPDTG